MLAGLFFKLNILSVAFGVSCDPNKANPQSNFFSFPHWWKYVNTGSGDALGNCTPSVKIPDGLLPIGLAVIDMLLYFAGIAAVISIIIAGVSYITAAGSSDKITAARKRIINSLLGLAVALVAITVVSFLGNSLGK
jgi:hypothetical protein